MSKAWMYEAFQPWDITLNEVRYKGEEEADTYFAQFGISQCEWPDSDDYPRIAENQADIVTMFNLRYGYRNLGYETLEEWQNMLQLTMDEIAPEFERAFQLYKDNASALVTVSKGRTITYNNVTDQEGGTTEESSKASSSDTPDSAVNLLDDSTENYATSASRNSGTITHGRSNTRSGSVTENEEPEGGEVANVNANIDAWRNLVRDFVGRFEKHFSKIYWY